MKYLIYLNVQLSRQATERITEYYTKAIANNDIIILDAFVDRVEVIKQHDEDVEIVCVRKDD